MLFSVLSPLKTHKAMKNRVKLATGGLMNVPSTYQQVGKP